MEIEDILDAYRKGNADSRVSLFLHYRDLRDRFERIEQEVPLDISGDATVLPRRRSLRERAAGFLFGGQVQQRLPVSGLRRRPWLASVTAKRPAR
jgi:hypothetical protein